MDARTEKNLYGIFTDRGYLCERLSRQEEQEFSRVEDNQGGFTFGVLVRFAAPPHTDPNHAINKNANNCNLKLVEYVFVFNGIILPKFTETFLKHNKNIFMMKPTVLTLCSIGSFEFNFKEYISRSNSYKTTGLKIFLNNANNDMKQTFEGYNSIYNAAEYFSWNNAIVKQVAEWIFKRNSSKYKLEPLMVRE